VAFALWVFLAIFYEEYRPRRGPLLYAVLLFAGITVVATIFGVNPSRSFWSNFERMEGLVAHLHLFAYFFVLAHVFRKEEWFWYFHAFLAAGLYENFYGLLQRLGYIASPQGGFRVDGTIGNPTYLAAYLIFILFFTAVLFAEAKHRILKYVYALLALFTLSIIYLTATRGAVLGLLAAVVVGGVVYVILFRPRNANESRYRMLAIVGIVLLCFGSFTLWLNRDSAVIKSYPALSRLTSLSFSERTISSRFSIWSMSLEAVKEHPVLGWGPENYNIVFSKYYRPELWPQEPWFDRSHNIVFDWLINAGALGLLSYLSIYGAAFFVLFSLYKKHHWSLSATLLAGGVLVAYFLQNLFVFDNIATYICFFTVLAYIHSESTNTSQQHNKASRSLLEYQSFTLAGILVVMFFVMYVVVARPLMTNQQLLKALVLGGGKAPNPQEAINSFKKALSYDYLGKTEVREQLAQYVFGSGFGRNAPPQLVNDGIQLALDEAKKNVEANSQDARAYVFLGALYSRINAGAANAQNGFLKDSIDTLEKAIKISPKKQLIYFELSDVYMRMNDFTNAIKVTTTAYDLDPTYPAAQTNLAILYILTGKQDMADTVLLKHRGTADPADGTIADSYSRIINDAYTKRDTGRVTYYAGRLTNVLKKMVAENPQNIEQRKRLASIYYLIGDVTNYNNILTETITLYPKSKEDIEAFKKQVQGITVER
jgi:O-antigen ligase